MFSYKIPKKITNKISRYIFSPPPSPPLPPELDAFLNTPKNYELKNMEDPESKSNHSDLVFYVVGCAGTGDATQKEVALLMNSVAKNEGQRPNFIMHLGDNFYPEGAPDEFNTKLFEKYFYSKYKDKELTEICDRPSFLIGGNHCYGEYSVDLSRIGGQIRHTFLENGKPSAERTALFAEKELDVSKLRGSFNMPARYYSLKVMWQGKKVKFYCADSTTFIKDYLDYLKEGEKQAANPEPSETKKEKTDKQPTEKQNQIAWLVEELSRDPDADNLLFLHHRPQNELGKRFFYSDDAIHYLTPEYLAGLKERNIEGDYHMMLGNVIDKLGKFTVFSAHAHGVNYVYSQKPGKELCLIGSAGGGGELEDRWNFENRDELGAYLKDHGFVKVTMTQNRLFFDLYTTKMHHHLKFERGSVEPIKRIPNSESPALLLFRTIVFEACDEYFEGFRVAGESLKNQVGNKCQNHGSYGSNRAEEMVNLFKSFNPITFAQAVRYVTQQMGQWRWTPQMSQQSLMPLLEKALKHHAGNLEYGKFVWLFEKHHAVLENHFTQCAANPADAMRLTAQLNKLYFEKEVKTDSTNAATIGEGGFATSVWSTATAFGTTLTGTVAGLFGGGRSSSPLLPPIQLPSVELDDEAAELSPQGSLRRLSFGSRKGSD